MNYLKQLIYEFTMNESQSSSCQQNSPEQSGQFQVIQFDEGCTIDDSKENYSKIKTISHGNKDDTIGLQCNHQKEHPSYQSRTKQQLQQQNQQRACNQKLSKQYTLVELQSQLQSNGSASTIQLDQYYMIVSAQQLTKKFTTQQQWSSFYKKINDFNTQQLLNLNISSSLACSMSNTDKKKSKLSLNLKQLNSLLQIKPHQFKLRVNYWNQVAIPPINIKFKYTQLANKKDPKKLQQNVNKLIATLAMPLLQSIKDKKLKPINNIEDQIQQWRACLIKVLTFYGANDKQIGYSKGLEYIAMGILVAKVFTCQMEGKQYQQQQHDNHEQFIHTTQQQYSQLSPLSPQLITPKPTVYSELQTHFKYLLFTKQLRNMYFPGTPKLYQQIYQLIQLMRTQVPQLLNKLQQLKVDFIKLFINYYKTFLLYKIKNPQVIRKVMELLVVYGIDIVRIVLTRIMSRNENKIRMKMSEEIELLRYLAESLVEDYFGNSDTEEVILKFKHLFVLDTIS